jgi:hypothetical protein
VANSEQNRFGQGERTDRHPKHQEGEAVERKHQMLARDMEEDEQGMPDLDSDLDDEIGDELLRLVFTACHPLLPREARAALALRMICGLTTEEIARAFLLPDATIAQRIVRAKRTLSESGLSYETPRGEQLSERLSSVLEVVYLIFNEGYAAARGEDWLRPQLCEEALRMGRVLTSIAAHEPEVHGLLALMELNTSRTAARKGGAASACLTRWPSIGNDWIRHARRFCSSPTMRLVPARRSLRITSHGGCSRPTTWSPCCSVPASCSPCSRAAARPWSDRFPTPSGATWKPGIW